jgi:hypothetical protein
MLPIPLMFNNQDVIKLSENHSFLKKKFNSYVHIRKHERGGTAYQYGDQVTGCMTREFKYDSSRSLGSFLPPSHPDQFYCFPRDKRVGA